MTASPVEALSQAEKIAAGEAKRKEVVRRVCQLVTEEFIAEEVYSPPDPPRFCVYNFAEDKFEFKEAITLGEKDEGGRNVVYKPIFNAHVRKGMVIMPRKPVVCTVEDAVSSSINLVLNGFDPCGKENELKLVTLAANSSWILDKEKPIIPIAGIGVFAPIIGIRGPSGSGKNRLANLLRFVSYHPFFDVSTHRIPSLYRPLDLWKGTLVVDEADIKSSGETSTLIHFLNARATGTPIGRQNPDRPSKCDAFESFGISIVAQRRSFEDNATESRTIPFYTDVTAQKLPTLETEEMIQKGMELQDKWLYIRMRYWKEINIDKCLWVEGISDPRLNSALLPIVALAKMAPNLKKIIADTIEPIEKARRQLKSQSDDGVIVNTLWEKIDDALWDLYNALYYVGESKETQKDEEGKDQKDLAIVKPLTITDLAEKFGVTSKRVRFIITSLNIAPEGAPIRVRLGKNRYRPIFFDPAKLEKRLRDFVVDYKNNALYEKLALSVPDVPHVPGSTSLSETLLDEYWMANGLANLACERSNLGQTGQVGQTLVYSKARELAKGGLVNKFEVADSLQDRLERSEVFQLLDALAKEGKLQPKGVEWFLVV